MFNSNSSSSFEEDSISIVELYNPYGGDETSKNEDEENEYERGELYGK